MPSSLRSPLAPRSCRRIGLRPSHRQSRMTWQQALARETMQSSRRRCTRTKSRAEGRSDSRAALEQPRLVGQVPEGASDPPHQVIV